MVERAFAHRPPDVRHLAVRDESRVGHRQARRGDAEAGHEPGFEPRALDERRGERVVRARGLDDVRAREELAQARRRGVSISSSARNLIARRRGRGRDARDAARDAARGGGPERRRARCARGRGDWHEEGGHVSRRERPRAARRVVARGGRHARGFVFTFCSHWRYPVPRKQCIVARRQCAARGRLVRADAHDAPPRPSPRPTPPRRSRRASPVVTPRGERRESRVVLLLLVIITVIFIIIITDDDDAPSSRPRPPRTRRR